MLNFETNKKLEVSGITVENLESGAFEKQLPEFYKLKENFEHNPWHDESTFEHVMMVFEESEDFFKGLTGEMKKYFDDKVSSETKKELFKLVILFHDIAKPETLKKDPQGQTFFPGHEKSGSQKAGEILERFSLDKKQKDYILMIIENHARAHDILFDKNNYQEKFAKLAEEFKDIYQELIVFGYVDTRGCILKLKNPEEFEFRMKVYKELFEKFKNEKYAK